MATESPLKMMKNAFNLTLKALSLFKIFKFLSDFIVYLPLPRKILGNMYILIVCEPGCDVIILKLILYA